MWTWAQWIADRTVQPTGLGAARQFFVDDPQEIAGLILDVAFPMALVRGALPLARSHARLDRPGGRIFKTLS